jgi:hypothetical protein
LKEHHVAFGFRKRRGESHHCIRKRVVLEVEALETRLTPAISNPTWQAIGPAPEVANMNVVGSGDMTNPANPANPADAAAGAVQVVRFAPGGTIAYIGTANGGVWDTLNYQTAAPNWVPLTASQASLSIQDIAVSQVPNAGGQTGLTIYAATANVSNLAGFGGGGAGIYKITIDPNTGQTDSVATLGQTPFVANSLQISSLRVTGTAQKNGQLTDQLLAGTINQNGTAGGIYISKDGGATWALALAEPSVSDLAQVPATGTITPPLFAAVPGPKWAVLISANGGQTWQRTPLNSTSNKRVGITDNIRLAVSGTAGGRTVTYVVYAALDVGGNFSGLYRSTNGGKSWTLLGALPGGNAALTNAGSPQGAENLSLAADPTNKNVIYIGGTTAQPSAVDPYLANIWRGTVNGAKVQWVHLVSTAGSPHPDSRNLVASGGSLYDVDDGGIYGLANPLAANPNQGVPPQWSSLVGNLQDSEVYSAAYDTLSGAYIAGTQDNGVPVQILNNGSPGFYDLSGGDGGIVAVDSTTQRTTNLAGAAASVRYYSYTNLQFFQQAWFDNTGRYLGAYAINLTLNGVVVNGAVGQGNNIFQFTQPYVLSSTNGNLLLLGGTSQGVSSIYQADFSTAFAPNPAESGTLAVALASQEITGLGASPTTNAGGTITALAFGNAAYVGTTNPNAPLLVRAAGATSFAKSTGYSSAGGAAPVAIAIDPRDDSHAYVLDNLDNLWVTLDGGNTFTQMGGANATVAANLPPLPADEQLLFGALAIIPMGTDAGSGEAVLVSNPPGATGGGVWITQVPAGAAANPPDFKQTSWQPWGDATQSSNPGLLPNVQVSSLQYYPTANLVVAATVGGGIWVVNSASTAVGLPAPVALVGGATTITNTIPQPANRPVGAVAIPSAFNLHAQNGKLLTDALVTLENRPDNFAESLAADVSATNITAAYDALNGTLTLSGLDTAADYQQVIQSIMFNDSLVDLSSDPRLLSIQVTDGVTWSDRVTITLDVIPDNSGPVVQLDGTDGAYITAAFTEGQGPVTLAPALALSDPESTTLASATVSILNLQDDEESLAANTAGTGIHASYDPNTAILTLVGADSLANYQKVLRTVTYNDTARDPGPLERDIAFTISDSTSTSPGDDVAVAMHAVNLAPLLASKGPISLPTAGITVQALLAGPNGDPIAQDFSGHDITGIAVIGVDNSQGVWQYRTASDQPWRDLGNPSVSQAVLLFNNTDTSIRFVRTASGSVNATLHFRVWDGTGEQQALAGLAGPADEPQNFQDAVRVTTVGSGGSSPFSAAVGVLTSVANNRRHLGRAHGGRMS